MSEEIIVLIAAIYAAIVALSFKKLGIGQALFWPFIIIFLGSYVFFQALTQASPPEE